MRDDASNQSQLDVIPRPTVTRPSKGAAVRKIVLATVWKVAMRPAQLKNPGEGWVFWFCFGQTSGQSPSVSDGNGLADVLGCGALRGLHAAVGRDRAGVTHPALDHHVGDAGEGEPCWCESRSERRSIGSRVSLSALRRGRSTPARARMRAEGLSHPLPAFARRRASLG